MSGLSLKPLSEATGHQFGVVVVLDESTGMSATDRGLELTAAQDIAVRRTGSQELGVVTFASAPSVVVPPTSNDQVIRAALASSPLPAPGASVPSALKLAYSQLRQAGVEVGAVIVVSPGHDLTTSAAETQARQQGLAMGYQTFTTEIGASTVANASPGGASTESAREHAVANQLSQAADIWSRLAAGYLASYRSTAASGQGVRVAVSATGLSGTPTLEYTAYRHTAPTVRVPPFNQLPSLVPDPGFAVVAHPAAATLPGTAPRSFWSNPLSLGLVALVCALLLGTALWLLIGGVGRSELEDRMAGFIPGEEPAEDPDALALVAPGVPPILARRRWWPGFALQVDVARWKRSPVALVRLATAGGLVAAVLFTATTGSVAAGIFLGLPSGPLVLWLLLRRAVRKSREKFSDRIPFALQDMAGAVRGGRSMTGAMAAVLDGADEPLRTEFERVVADEQLGRPIEVSLQTTAERMHSEDMQQVALVAALHRRSGASVAEALDHVAEGARERAELIRELKSLTGQARLSSRILTGLPVVLFLALSVLNPSYMSPLTSTTGGFVVTGFCVFMIFLGWLSMRRIIKVDG